MDFPINSTQILESYNELWISIFASAITEFVYGCKEEGVWTLSDLISQMATAEIRTPDLGGGNAHDSITTLYVLSNLPKVHDLKFRYCYPDTNSLHHIPSPYLPASKPCFWQGIRRLTLSNLHEVVLW